MTYEILTGVSSKNLRRATEIQETIEALQIELRKLLSGPGAASAKAKQGLSKSASEPAAPASKGGSASKETGKRRGVLTPEGRAKLSATAKARWVKFRAEKKRKAAAKAAAAKPAAAKPAAAKATAGSQGASK